MVRQKRNIKYTKIMINESFTPETHAVYLFIKYISHQVLGRLQPNTLTVCNKALITDNATVTKLFIIKTTCKHAQKLDREKVVKTLLKWQDNTGTISKRKARALSLN